MRIIIRMKSTKNMLLNEAILGYVPSTIDSNRIVDSEYNVQVHLGNKYSKEEAEYCVNSLRSLLKSLYHEFDCITVKLVRHKPYDGAYFHHINIASGFISHIPYKDIAYLVYSRMFVGFVKIKNKYNNYSNSITPLEAFVTNKDNKPIKN